MTDSNEALINISAYAADQSDQSNKSPYTIAKVKRQSFNNVPSNWVADWLLHVLQKPASFLIANSDYTLTPIEQQAFADGIAHMQAGTPLAYLTGTQAFWSLNFKVNEHTLIPRPDTEVLVEQVLDWIAKHETANATSQNISLNKCNLYTSQSSTVGTYFSNPNEYPSATKRLLDLGTGSGCIAISLAHELAHNSQQQWQVTALDLSLEALKVAKHNAQINHVDNTRFLQSDWFSALAKQEDDDVQFDVIVSNPPYIVHNDNHLNKLSAEPITALVADDNGLADIKKIIVAAKSHLKQNGLLALEHGYNQGKAVRSVFSKYGYSEVKTIKDYGGNDRVTMGTKR